MPATLQAVNYPQNTPNDAGVVGIPYYRAFLVNEIFGELVPPITLTVTEGGLPPGLSYSILNCGHIEYRPPGCACTVVISGTPTTPGPFLIGIHIEDSAGHYVDLPSSPGNPYPTGVCATDWLFGDMTIFPDTASVGIAASGPSFQYRLPLATKDVPYSYVFPEDYCNAIFATIFYPTTFPQRVPKDIGPIYVNPDCAVRPWYNYPPLNVIADPANGFVYPPYTFSSSFPARVSNMSGRDIDGGSGLFASGLSLSSGGVISGTPIIGSGNYSNYNYNFNITITDNHGRQSNRQNFLYIEGTETNECSPAPAQGGDCCCCCQPISLTTTKYNPFMCHM